MLERRYIFNEKRTTGPHLIWLIIIVVLTIAIGPILYLLPTAKDKRLAGLRETARQLGLHVKITFLPKLDPRAAERVNSAGAERMTTIACAGYQLPVGKRLDASGFVLRRLPSASTRLVHEVIKGWGTLDSKERDQLRGRTALLGMLAQIVSKLPQDALGLGYDDRSVVCYWTEASGADEATVAGLRELLQTLADALIDEFSIVPNEGI